MIVVAPSLGHGLSGFEMKSPFSNARWRRNPQEGHLLSVVISTSSFDGITFVKLRPAATHAIIMRIRTSDPPPSFTLAPVPNNPPKEKKTTIKSAVTIIRMNLAMSNLYGKIIPHAVLLSNQLVLCLWGIHKRA